MCAGVIMAASKTKPRNGKPQSQRFIEAAREAGASEDEAKAKPKDERQPPK